MVAGSLSVAAAPSHSQATLSWRYGRTMQPKIGSRKADSAYVTIPRGDYLGNYVKIEFNGQTWWGVIQDGIDSRDGLLDDVTPTGTQSYTAFGLTWFLDQGMPILKSKIRYTGGTLEIDRTIPFNGGTDSAARKNAVGWKNYDATNKCFTDASQTPAPTAWKASDAISYLIANFTPKNAAGTVLVQYELATDAATYLDYELPRTDYDGLTLWQAIVRLVDRKRGLLLMTDVVGNKVRLIVRSQNAASITLPSGGVIPANPDTRSYNFDRAYNVSNPTISTTLLSRYDQVICLGERAGSVFTIRPQTNAEPEWSGDRQTEYRQGASLLTGYSSLNDSDKAAANEDRRAADDLARVYSWWKMKAAWDGRSDTDPSSVSAPYALPKIDADGVADLATRADVQRSGLRIATFLPLRQGLDYHTATITPATNDSDSVDADFLPPILLLKTTAIRSSGDAGWVHGERLNAAAASQSSKRPNNFSVDLSVREDAIGLILKTQGAPQHYLAKDDFSSLAAFDDIPSGEGINKQDWLATIYVQQDQYCRAQYPLQADLPSLDLIRPLILRIANAFLDYVVPGTILAVKAGVLQKTTAGGYVRDDRPRLKDIARLAYEWHGQTRRTLSLSLRGIVSSFSVGHLITTIGAGSTLETINTAITAVTYDFNGGTMQIQTQFGELDFTA